jgi:hypothetical protein
MYKTGKLTPWWDNNFKNFNYTKQPISKQEVDLWTSQGYDYVKSFTGGMYDSRNPMPDWISKFDNLFGLENQTYTFYKMSTLEIMPVHVDHFNTYTRLFNTDVKNVCRVLVMLEDWQSGHYLEINNKGVVNWSAGDYFLWSHDVPHAASNIGIEDRFTLQITGTLNA